MQERPDRVFYIPVKRSGGYVNLMSLFFSVDCPNGMNTIMTIAPTA